jgi:lactate permease
MAFVTAIAPLCLLVAIMTSPWPRRWCPVPAHIALPVVALVACFLRLFDAELVPIQAAVIDGVLSSFTPLAIVFGAVLLFKTMEASGAMAVLADWLRRLSPDPIAQLMLVGWAFSFLIEGLSGFGTPAALAAPILVGIGFPPLRVAAMCLVMNSVPVSFGAVGTPTWFGLSGVELAEGELADIARRTALVHSAAAPIIALLALRIVVSWSEIRRRLWFILLVVAGSVGPYVVTASVSVEFPSIVGGLSGLAVAGALVGRGIGLPVSSAAALPPSAASMSVLRAASPLAATVVLLAMTRIESIGLKALLTSEAGAVSTTVPWLGEAWISPALVVGVRSLLGTDAEWRMQLLYVPFLLPFVVVALAAIPVLAMPAIAVRTAWGETMRRLARPAVALAGALVLTTVMTLGGDASPVAQIGLAAAGVAGQSWPFLAPLLGALGAFFSGSNTVSNLTFAPVQASIADALGLDRSTVLALQSVGGAMGNMICIHNIVAVAAVVGLSESRVDGRSSGEVAAVLRRTIGPLAVYAFVAAAMAGLFAVVFG